MATDPDRTTGLLGTILGWVAFASVACLTIFSVASAGLFGTLNDVGNGLVGVLTGVLAWRLARHGPGGSQGTGAAAAVSGVAGGAVMVVGSAMVLSRASGWFLAGLVSSVGAALIGLWLVALARSLRAQGRWPRRHATLGVVAGAAMMTGIVAAPGIAMRLDDMETAPGWIWIAFVSWLGLYVLYPAWAIWLGRISRRGV